MAQTPLPNAPGVLEVKMSYLQGQQVLQNVYHVYKAGAWDDGEIATALGIFEDWEENTAKAERSSTCGLVEIRGTDLSSPAANYRSSDLPTPIFGARGSQNLPENVTWAIQAGTGQRGRGRQGRTFWIGLCEDQTNGSVMITGNAASIVAALNTLLADVNSGTGGEMVTLHRMEGGQPLDPATHSAIGTYGASDLTTDSQKNRLPNHKRKKRPTP